MDSESFKIENEIDYSNDYNKLIIWKSIGKPYYDTKIPQWYQFAKKVHFDELNRIYQNWDTHSIIPHFKLMNVFRRISFLTILKMDKYNDIPIDIFRLINNFFDENENKVIDMSKREIYVDMYERRQAYLDNYY